MPFRIPPTRSPRANKRVRAFVISSFVLLLAAAVFAGHRHLSDRPGEAALARLIPADAAFVATLDLTSSPVQAEVFRRLAQAAKTNHLDARLDNAFTDAPVVRDLRPFFAGSIAVALWPEAGRVADFNGDGVILLAVRDPATVAQKLAQSATRTETTNGLNIVVFHTARGKSVYATVIGAYVAVGPAPNSLLRVAAVWRGQALPLADRADYKQARAALPVDANLMCFVAPSALSALGEEGRRTARLSADPLRGAAWMALGATLRADGVVFDYRSPWEERAQPGLQTLAAIAPVDTDRIMQLPAGALGVWALSQPGRYVNAAQSSFAAQPSDARRALDQGAQAFERETGLSVDRDIAPNLSGNLLLAAYPDNAGGVDGLVVIDDAHNADPAALAEKIRLYAQQQMDLHFQSAQRDGATIWTLAKNEPEDAPGITFDERGIRVQGAGGASVVVNEHGVAVRGANGARVSVNENGVRVDPRTAAGVLSASVPPQTAEVIEKFAKNKQLVWAQAGKTVLVASSPALLERALAARHATGAVFLPGPRLTPGAQSLLLVRPGLIRNAFRSNTVAGDLLALFGDADLFASTRYDGRTATGTLFLPLDYERAIRLLNKAAQQHQQRSGE